MTKNQSFVIMLLLFVVIFIYYLNKKRHLIQLMLNSGVKPKIFGETPDLPNQMYPFFIT